MWMAAASSSAMYLRRCMSTALKKRFYKDVNVVSSGDQRFEIVLDSRKLKTPGGHVFSVTNHSLALAVAQEWRAQTDKIMPSQMHLTGLCSTCTDNPTGATKFQLVNSVLGFIDTDTVLFFSAEPEALLRRQQAEWLPVIQWFCQRFEVDLQPCFGVSLRQPTISEQDRNRIRSQLLSYHFNAVQGFCFGADAIKSVILMSAVVERRLSVEAAVRLARLEVEHQIDQWGVVRWAHDLELHDSTSRVAAANIFFQCHNSHHFTLAKS